MIPGANVKTEAKLEENEEFDVFTLYFVVCIEIVINTQLIIKIIRNLRVI